MIKGDVFFALCLARLLEDKCESFNGPYGKVYLDAWRQSYTKKLGADASCVDIAKFAQSHDADQMDGLQKPVKGKTFEIYFEHVVRHSLVVSRAPSPAKL